MKFFRAFGSIHTYAHHLCFSVSVQSCAAASMNAQLTWSKVDSCRKQAFSPLCAFYSPFEGSMSVMAIFRH
jgi:hypothetical protein